jgi:ribosomal protein S18 acetylase RimI-like enzyme
LGIRLKNIQPEDLETLSDFFAGNNVPGITDSFTPFPLTPETAEWIACQPHRDRFYLAFDGNTPVGFSMLRGWDEGYSIPSFGIFIDHRQHGHGFGRELLALTVGEAKNLGCEKVRLSVYASNPAACRIYRDLGFVEAERISITHLGQKDQKIVMVKELNS